MLAWLKNIIEELHAYDGTFNILQTVMILVMIVGRLKLLDMIALEDKHYQVLFKGLCTIPEFMNTNDWSHLIPIKESFLKNDALKSDFVYFLKQMQHKPKKPIIEVIFSFPMLHFAQGVWIPFNSIITYLNFDSSRKAALNYFKQVAIKW